MHITISLTIQIITFTLHALLVISIYFSEFLQHIRLIAWFAYVWSTVFF